MPVDKFTSQTSYFAYIYNQKVLTMKRIGLAYLIFHFSGTLLFAQNIQWHWAKALHTPDVERATAVVSDPNSGEIYLACQWRGSLAITFPDGVTESTDFTTTFGGVDGMVVKFDPDGNVLWAFKVGSEGDDRINDILVDDEGFLYICGTVANGNSNFAGTGPLNADTEFINPGDYKSFLAKYDPGGALVWVRFAGELEASEGQGIATNPEGVFLTGYYRGIISFGVLPPSISIGGTDLFVTMYSRDGDEMWHVSAGSNEDDYTEGITCDETNFYVAGRFKGAFLDYRDMSGEVVASTINTAEGQDDAFVASFTIDGFHQWTRIITSAMDDDCRGIVMDHDQIYLAGTIGQEALFPMYAANPVPYKGGKDTYVCALQRDNGETRWVQTLAGDADGDQVVRDLSIDRSGSLYLTGFYTSNVATVDTLNDSRGAEDVFLASYTGSGDEKWIRTVGSPGTDMGNGVCASTPETVYLAGEYSDVIAFDSQLLPGDSNQNAFLARLNLDCMDAVGGMLTAMDTVVAEGEVVTLTLQDYYGDIRWEFSLPGINNWSLLTADLSETIQHFPSGTADYRAFVTSGNCAPDTSNVLRIEVLNSTIHFADAGEDMTVCPGDSVQLKASGGDFYKWDPPRNLDLPDTANPWAKPGITTSYVVHVTRMDGLTDTDTVTVFVLPRPRVEAGEDMEICRGDQVQLSAISDFDLRWFPPEWLDDQTRPDPVAIIDTTTTFRVFVKDSNGCIGFDTTTVFVKEPPVAYAGEDKVIATRFEIRLEATLEPWESGTWNVISGNGVFENSHAPDTRVTDLELGENKFSWTVTNNICPESVDEVIIRVNDLLIPTVITPNGDGKNDYFLVRGIERYGESELVVLNRWGEEVYKAGPYNNNWDGVSLNGEVLPEDTYYIVLKIEEDDVRKGYLMIVR